MINSSTTDFGVYTFKTLFDHIKKNPKAIFIIYSSITPDDICFYGKGVDQIATLKYSKFNPSKQKAVMVPEKYRTQIREILKRIGENGKNNYISAVCNSSKQSSH